MPRPPRPKAEHAWWTRTLALILALAFAPSLPAATVITGDVTPALPWNASTNPRIGNFGAGTLTVDGGSQLSSGAGYLGYSTGSTGTATITGANSTWANSGALEVGRFGSGSLRVEAGGMVSNTTGYIGRNTSSVGAVTITGAGSVWTNSSLIRIGNAGSGALRVEAGGKVSSNSAYLGDGAGATGTATITGAGSTWTNSNALYVGYYGSGALRVEAGGQVSSEFGYLSSISTATITGLGSTWTSFELRVRSSDSGALTVVDGGHITAGTLYASPDDLYGNGTIAATAGAVLDADLQFNAARPTQNIIGFGAGGTLTVTPAASGNLGAGYEGAGRLTIADGVAIASLGGYVGYESGSTGTATITGVGSEWTNVGLRVGDSGSGALRVDSGGQIRSAMGFLGSNAGSTGVATITGTGSAWTTASTFEIAGSGSGALHVESGGRVSNSTCYVGRNTGSMGAVTITGVNSTFVSSSLHVGSSGSGALRVETGGLVVINGSGYLGYNAGSSGTATVTGMGSKWRSNSALYVGNSGSGALTITAGGLVRIDGTLTIDFNGGNDSFVNMASGGMLALWGDADDSLAQFLGLVSGTDAIRYWSPSLAGWTPLTAATLGVDYTLQFQNTGDLNGYTLLTVLAPGPPGDFNFDNRVDGADFLAWQRGDSPTPNSADDLATWRANFGLVATTPATTAVPEPGTCALAGIALAGLLLNRRSPRR